MYDRSKQNQIASFFSPDQDIAEEDEDSNKPDQSKQTESARLQLESVSLQAALPNLVPEEEMLLKSCLDEIHNIVGESIQESVIIGQILKHKFNVEKALDGCLSGVADHKGNFSHLFCFELCDGLVKKVPICNRESKKGRS